jgi:hypothetical protein
LWKVSWSRRGGGGRGKREKASEIERELAVYGLVILALYERLSGHVVETRSPRWIIREVIYTPAGWMRPTLAEALDDDVERHIQVQHQS